MACAMTETVAIEPTMNMTLQVKPYPPKGSGPPASTTTMKLQHLRIDPSRALEPARKKLTTVEAQRIMAVFEETIRRVEIVTVLPYIIKHIDRYRVSLGGELVELLKHHSVIITSYDEIRRELDKMLGKRASLEAERSLTPSDTNIMQDSTLTVGQGSGHGIRRQTSTSRPFSASLGSRSATVSNVGSQASITSNVGVKCSSVKEMSVASADGKRPFTVGERPQSRISSAASGRSQEKSRMGSAASGRSQEKSRMGSAASERSQEKARKSNAQSKHSDDQDEIGEKPDEALQEDDVGEDVSEEVVVSDEMMEAIMRNLSLVAQQMSHSTRNILRAFSLNPAVMTLITNDMTGRGSQCKKMLTYLQELREILMGKLLTTPEEERERMAYLTEISKRERHNAVIIEKLEAELKEKNDDKDEEIRKKNDVIKHLQSELHQIEKFSEEHIRRVRTDAEKQEAADEKNSDGKRQKLQAEVGQLRSQLQNAIMEHREAEQELRKKKFKVETEVENWIQRYDQELGERQDEYEEIDEIYTEEKKQLHELEERFRTLEAEYTSIMEERRLAREKREKAERELAMLVKSATTIQAFWRSYKVRKALKARKKKKGKK